MTNVSIMSDYLARAAAAALLAALLGATTGGTAKADDITSAFRLFDTARLGAFAHNPDNKESGDVDISGHVVTSRLYTSTTGIGLVDFFLSPRMHVGVMANTGGNTSYAYTGLTWRTGEWYGLFGEFDFGGAVNNYEVAPDRANLGCHVTFRESAGIGYRFNDRLDIVASAEHISHADLCGDDNAGLTNFGVRVGYRF